MPIDYFSKYFSDNNAANKNLIIVQMSDAAKLGRKRPITEEETIRAERKWAVNSEINSGILQERIIFYYSNLERNDMNQKRDEYVALYDARASGKSTLAHLIRRQLKDEGFY
ncbi:hypothetical protein RhiirB3_471132 [Rhizophagus irregularis]|nr:hypothetical protein RhiirB3_471132 [Rhizophagus irregularis]